MSQVTSTENENSTAKMANASRVNPLKKLFGGLTMSWPKVIIFAIVAGVYTGLINQVPALENTSFRDIAITWEAWAFMALVICSNCQKPLEAGAKAFVFFLISQPLVYIVEIPMLGTFRWDYYRFWAILTLFTFPAGIIAYYLRKQTWWGALLLIFTATACLLPVGEYAACVVCAVSAGQPPYHLLTLLFCLVALVIYVFVFRQSALSRLVCGVSIAVLLVVFGILGYHPYNSTGYGLPDAQGTWSFVDENPGFVKDVVIETSTEEYVAGSTLEFSTPNNIPGQTDIILTNTDGQRWCLHLENEYSPDTRGYVTQTKLTKIVD